MQFVYIEICLWQWGLSGDDENDIYGASESQN